jgi:tyrosine-protein phosphatase YwqE
MWPFKPSTVKVADSGILQGITEWHCHLLPGVDDGVDALEETMEILHLMKNVGIATVHLTPHIMEDVPNTPADLTARYEKLLAHVEGDADVPTLLLGAEHMLDTLFVERLGAHDVLPIALRTPGRADTLLVETSFVSAPFGFYQLLADIRSAGYFPLLAHPERYLYMTDDDYRRLRAEDTMMQLNITSLTGFYGRHVQQRAIRLLQDGMYTCVGTDTHSLDAFRHFLNSPIRRDLLKLLAPIMPK